MNEAGVNFMRAKILEKLRELKDVGRKINCATKCFKQGGSGTY